MDMKELGYLWDNNANLRAFCMAIRFGEGTQDEDGYRRMFGGELFSSFHDHPRVAVTMKMRGGAHLTSTAAGCGQFLARTWDDLVNQYGFPDFSPRNQDLGMAALVIRRGAMPDVLAGRIEDAVRKCNREWASLPESPYGQPTVTMGEFLQKFSVALGLETTHVAQESSAKEVGLGPVINTLADTNEIFKTPPFTPKPAIPEPQLKVGIIDALRVGQVVMNPASLKNKGTLAMVIATGIAAFVHFGGRYVDLSWLDKDTVTELAGGISAVICLYVNYASSDKVGLLPAKKPEAGVPADSGLDRNGEETMRAGGG